MLFFIAILIYYLLVILKRILKPRVVPRLHKYNIENNLLFTIICIGYIAYKLLIQNMTIEQFRQFYFRSRISIYNLYNKYNFIYIILLL